MTLKKVLLPKPHENAANLRSLQRGGRHPQQIVDLARKYTGPAMRKMALLAGLIPGEALPKIKVLDRLGNLVEVDQVVPANVQLAACEVLIDRGYGKAPQAIFLGNESSLGEGGSAMTIEQKIAAIRAQREMQGKTHDLEASAIVEAETTETRMVNVTPAPQPPAAPDPRDDI